MASLLLADRVFTLLPAPEAGRTREAIADAADRLPRYLRLMESWRWSMPLWRQGVLASSLEGEDLASGIAPVHERVHTDDSLAALRALLDGAPPRTPDQALDALCADILKGGPDPGMNIPIAAALDRFALRHGLFSARATPSSITQKVEERLCDRLFAIAAPVLLRASGQRILDARERLANSLGPLREEILVAARARSGEDPTRTGTPTERLRLAALEYSRAFEATRKNLAAGDDEEGRRVTHGYVSITAVAAPPDLVLRASMAAAKAVSRTGRAPSATAPVPSIEAPDSPRLMLLVIKPLNSRPDRLD
jgi:hypothetical protein